MDKGSKVTKQPTIKQLLAVLNNKKHLMTESQKEVLWSYYRLLCKDGIPQQKHVDAWDAFVKTEQSETVPPSEIETLRFNLKALSDRLEMTIDLFADQLDEINRKLDQNKPNQTDRGDK